MEKGHESQKRRRERHYVTRFLEAINYDSEYLTDNMLPEPDFKLYIDDRIIGIEETQILYIDCKGFSRPQYISTCEAITTRAKEIFDSYETQQKLDVCISYADHSGTTNYKVGNLIRNKKEQESLALEIAGLVVNNMPWIDGEQAAIDHYNPSFFNLLSPKVNFIHIYNTTGKHPSFWTNAYAGVCPRLTPELISQSIKKKNSKPQSYKEQYSGIWLLLTINGFRYDANYVTDDLYEALDIIYTTAFSRVFVFDVGDEKVIELKLK
ncbi:hypothetical protein [Pontibacter russatus]|uniref:hypothetical protein n=1 Tax=Pontibacter russatus TaxID=2694929 RepID=UPI00137B5382|nr:hypothetical protein [Pontibacter russatus]